MNKNAKRNRCVSVRFNDWELSGLDRRRGRIQRGTFLRNLYLGKREPRQIPQPNREAYAETARWASNLAQIARKLNMGGEVPVQEVEAILGHFRRALVGMTEAGDDDSQDISR